MSTSPASQGASLHEIGLNILNTLGLLQKEGNPAISQIQNKIIELIEQINRESSEKIDLMLTEAQEKILQNEEELKIISESNSMKLKEIKDLKTKIIKLELDLSQESDKAGRQAIYIKSKDNEITKLKQEIDRLNSTIVMSNSDDLLHIKSYMNEKPVQTSEDKSKNADKKEEYINSRITAELLRLINLIESSLSEGPSGDISSIINSRFQSIDNVKQLVQAFEYTKILEMSLKIICDVIITSTNINSSRKAETAKPKTFTSSEYSEGEDPNSQNLYQTSKGLTPVLKINPVLSRSASKSVTTSRNSKAKTKHCETALGTPSRYGSKAVFNQFTKRVTDYFDPYIQYGGKSMYNY